MLQHHTSLAQIFQHIPALATLQKAMMPLVRWKTPAMPSTNVVWLDVQHMGKLDHSTLKYVSYILPQRMYL